MEEFFREDDNADLIAIILGYSLTAMGTWWLIKRMDVTNSGRPYPIAWLTTFVCLGFFFPSVAMVGMTVWELARRITE